LIRWLFQVSGFPLIQWVECPLFQFQLFEVPLPNVLVRMPKGKVWFVFWAVLVLMSLSVMSDELSAQEHPLGDQAKAVDGGSRSTQDNKALSLADVTL